MKRILSRVRKPALALALCSGLSACVELSTQLGARPDTDRGIVFNHPRHAEEGMDCTDCHDFSSGDRPAMPTHEIYSLCHEIPEDEPLAESCALCHTNPGRTVVAWASFMGADNTFNHAPHIEQEMACTVCHESPGEQPFPKGPLMNFCTDCHETLSAELNQCSTCHSELDLDVVPEFRGAVRLAHDVPAVWERIHGREAEVNAEFCERCHVQEEHCDTCHRTQEPDNHTLAWNRRTHGLEATWDRQSCAVCHEEDSCLKCHQNSRPTSHRGQFGRPLNTHCVQCHFPEDQQNCTVCHESISHGRATFSPHALGIFPSNCALCHPGGLPKRAPHLLNSSARCTDCHT